MTYVIGLTGNIASGKTAAAHYFSTLGIDVFNADHVAKALTMKGEHAYEQIVSHFGPEILLDNGELDRRQLRSLIFSNPNERLWLEALLHPLIRAHLEKKVQSAKSAYCIVEIPLLINREHYPYINKVLLITASDETLIERVMARDACTKEQAQAILATQPSSAQRLKIADEVIYNDADIHTLFQKIQGLHHQYLAFLGES